MGQNLEAELVDVCIVLCGEDDGIIGKVRWGDLLGYVFKRVIYI